MLHYPLYYHHYAIIISTSSILYLLHTTILLSSASIIFIIIIIIIILLPAAVGGHRVLHILRKGLWKAAAAITRGPYSCQEALYQRNCYRTIEKMASMEEEEEVDFGEGDNSEEIKVNVNVQDSGTGRVTTLARQLFHQCQRGIKFNHPLH